MLGPRGASSSALRVVSLLPSVTENTCALLASCRSRRAASGALEALPELVGRSHECDFPPDVVQQLPVLTAPRTAFTSSAEVHSQVRAALASASSLYHLDAAKLAALRPDVILTQSSCRVCSIDLASVEAALQAEGGGEQTALDALVAVPSSTGASDAASTCALTAGGSKTALTQIVTVNPTSLMDAVVTQFQQLGRALGVPEEGDAMAQEHLKTLQQLTKQAEMLLAKTGAEKPRVALIEWLDPLFLGTSGWMREIVEAAGGQVVESMDGQADGKKVDVVVVALCGLTLDKTEVELQEGRVGSWWPELFARYSNDEAPPVYIVDGTSMFTRPTKRLLTALEWLVHVLHEPKSEWVKRSTFPFKKFEASTTAVTSTATNASTRNGESKSPELLEIEELHRVACDHQQPMYTDPATGYSVMTAYILKERQVCCGNGCRHCPYGHANVKDPSRRKNTLAGTAFLQPRRRSSGARKDARGGQVLWPKGVQAADASASELVVMFWSGGKDSFLALSFLYESYAAQHRPMPRVVLLTTIDPDTNAVPIQSIEVQTIVAQAEALELPLCLVAVGLGDAYTSAVQSALRDLPEQMTRIQKSKKTPKNLDPTPAIAALAFGDLHLQDIRNWREQTFAKQFTLRFPVWQKDYRTELLPALSRLCVKTGAKIYFSNIDTDRVGCSSEAAWQLGQEYDWEQVEARNKHSDQPVDLMGESGEFHTCVKFPGMS
ncbi:hypothetical protein BBJ28_00004169 [Nothophytophthora sp. Chile5]|nr:hypothetical protein BBJ28_00004169 [Nothophytophthora sp. Chile5]